MYIFKNNNPNGLLVGDCVIRAISEVMDEAGTEKEREAISACMKELGL